MRAVVCFAALLLPACAKSPPPPGKDVTVEQVCDEKNDTQVRVTGYLRYPRQMMGFCSSYGGHKTCDMSLYATAETPQPYDVMRPKEQTRELPHIKVSVPVGDDPGEMDELPKTYSDQDVVLHLAGKGRASDGDKVTLSGKVSVIESPEPDGKTRRTCWLDVAWATL